MMKKLMLVGIASSLLVACGGNSFSGSVKGSSLNPQDAVFLVINSTSGSGQLGFLAVSDQPNLCQTLKDNHSLKNATTFSAILAVSDSQGHGQPLVTGTYNVTTLTSSATGNLALVGFSKTDASCNSTYSSDTAPSGKSGTVTLSSFEAKAGGSAHGTFDVTYDSNDHVTGAFNAAYCDAPTNSTTEPTCQ